MTFASDAFAGTALQELSAYSASWAKQTGYTADGIVGGDGQWAVSSSESTYACYAHSATPPSANYTVAADIALRSGAPEHVGVIGRAQVGAQTFYWLLYSHQSTQLRLFKTVGGVQTQLGTAFPMTLGATAQRIELRMDGGNISGYVDGVLRIGPVSDSSISAAGRAGLIMLGTRTSGGSDRLSLDNWAAAGIAGDTTPPTLTGPTGSSTGASTASGSVSTNEAGGTLYFLASASSTATVAAVKAGGSQAVSAAGTQNVTVSGLTASTTYFLHFVHTDAAGNDSVVASSASFTTAAGGDTTNPTLTGSITIGTVTSSSIQMSWPAGADNVAVTGYDVSSNGGTSWTSLGNVLTHTFTGLAASTSYQLRVRAKDAAGNVSTALSASQATNAPAATPSLSSAPVKNNTGTVLANTSIAKVAVLRLSDMASVLTLTNQTTSGAGVLTITSATLVAATSYVVVLSSADGGALGTFLATAA